MARGQEEKEQIKQKIMEVFDGAFEDGKTIRIPINGLEIKITLTAAKDVIGSGNAATAPINASQPSVGGPSDPSTAAEIPWDAPADSYKPTPKEKEDISILLKSLGF